MLPANNSKFFPTKNHSKLRNKMPNNEDFDDLDNVSLDYSFSPLASSSQQYSTTEQQVATAINQPDTLEIARSLHEGLQAMHSTSMSKFGLWTSFVNPSTNENDQEITLTQLNNIVSGHKIWNLRQWINAQEEYFQEMDCSNISSIKKNVNEVIPFLAAIILRVDSSKDMIVMNSVTLTLKDPSGEIKAVLPKDLHSDCEHLLPNSVVVLRNFRILKISENFARYYIFLSKANIEAVFSIKTHSKISYFTSETPSEHEERQESQETQETVRTANPKAKVLNEKKMEFAMPDLNVDFDLDCDFNSNLATNLQKLPEISNISNLNTADTCATGTKRFKYVKRWNTEKKAESQLDSDSAHSDKAKNDCSSSQFSVKAENPEDAQIVEEIFDGLDVSCFLDDF